MIYDITCIIDSGEVFRAFYLTARISNSSDHVF